KTKNSKGLGPHLQRALRSLLHEYDFPVFETHADEVAIVIEVEELSSRTAGLFTEEIGQLVVTVLVGLESLITSSIAFEEFFLDVRDAGGCQECRTPVQSAENLIRDLIRFDVSGPSDHRGDAE